MFQWFKNLFASHDIQAFYDSADDADGMRMCGSPRNSKWPAKEREILALYPTCAACGDTRLLQVHHKKPFHLFPDLELDNENLMVLCMQHQCHFLIGHGGNWTRFNADVIKDARYFLAMMQRIKANGMRSTEDTECSGI